MDVKETSVIRGRPSENSWNFLREVLMKGRLDEALEVCMRVLRDNLALQKGEVFLSVSHSDHDGELAELFAACANSFGASASTVKIVGSGHLKEPDRAVREALCNADAVVSIASINKTMATRKAMDEGTRFLHAPFLERDTFIRLMKADTALMLKKSQQFARRLELATVFHMKSELGTDFRVSIAGKDAFVFDGTAREKGRSDVIPPGLVEMAPVSGTGEGTVVVDGCIRPGGVVSRPMSLDVRGGYITEITGGPEARALWDYLRRFEDEETLACPAHIGPGMNPFAVLCNNIVEAERVEGTITVGIGRNTDIEGGDINAKGHTDVTLTNADVFLDDEQVIEKGQLCM